VILDEIQHAPHLLHHVKERIDADPRARGRYVLTVSHNLLLLESVSESLAGRAAILQLWPLAWREMDGEPGRPLPWEPRGGRGTGREDAWTRILRGGWPALRADPSVDGELWHSSYEQTLLERDVRVARSVGDLTQFRSFVRGLAARAGGLLDLSALARDVGVAVNTAKAWLSVLEAMHQVFVVRPWHANLGKRLVKTPRVYFTDTGTLCHLVGLRSAEHARSGPMAGALFENAVVAEVHKAILHRGRTPRLHFWRTATGVEVDLLVEEEGRLVPVEIKSGATPRPAMADGILSLRRDLGAVVGPGFLVHGGTEDREIAPGVRAIPVGRV
jgi:hypothetical protein